MFTHWMTKGIREGRTRGGGGGREEEGKSGRGKKSELVLDSDHDFFSQLRSYDLR